MPDKRPGTPEECRRKLGRRMADMAVRLPVGAIRDHLFDGAANGLRWDDRRAVPAAVAYVVYESGGKWLTVHLYY